MQRRPTAVWPYFLVSAFLFVLSVTAPRGWERIAQRRSLELAGTLPSTTIASHGDEWSKRPAASIGTQSLPMPRTAAEYRPATAEMPAIDRSRTFVNASPKPEAPVCEASVAPQPRALVVEATVPPAAMQPTVAEPVVPPSAPAVVVERTVTLGPVTVGAIRLSGIATLSGPSVVAGPAQEAEPTPVADPALVAASMPQPRIAAAAFVPSPAVASQPTIAPPQKPEAMIPLEIAPRQIEVVAVEPPGWWPVPTDLITRLENLRDRPAVQTWAEHTVAILRDLTRTTDPTAPRVSELLAELRTVVADPVALYANRADEATALEVQLTRHALLRRLDVWESLTEVLRQTAAGAETIVRDAPQRLELCLGEIEREFDAAGENGRSWREYLLIDSLRNSVCTGTGEEEQRRGLVREVLERLAIAGETVENGEFLRTGSFARLDDCLRDLSEAEIDGQRLLESIELFEQGGLPSHAHALAAECRLLDESSHESRRKLAEWLNSYYRNANVRIAFSPELLNRALPDSLKRNAPINETILGQATTGWSTTRTGLNVRFLPHDGRLAIRFEAEGIVNSQTRTYSGPVRLFSNSNSQFAALKNLALTPAGIAAEPSVALSQSNTRLRSIESDYDRMPILGAIVSSIARDKHAESKAAAQREASWKLSRQVERQLDVDIERYLEDADRRFAGRIVEPLTRLQITPQFVELRTTEDRATMRVRILGEDQLAANTPRPRANADSLGSVQIHQSALNNVVERLDFGGREFALPDLCRYVADTLGLPLNRDPETLPEELLLTFAAVDPVTIRFDEGRVELRMALDELKYADKSWKDFAVRASFKPEVIGDAHYLVRDGLVRLSGPRLGTAAQISLRTVFAKIFPDDLQIALRPAALDDPRFADLDIEQMEIRDGWLGFAIGPRPATTALPHLPIRR